MNGPQDAEPPRRWARALSASFAIAGAGIYVRSFPNAGDSSLGEFALGGAVGALMAPVGYALG